MLEGITQHRNRFDDTQVLFVGVSIDPNDDRLGRIKALVPGIRFFRDGDQTISRLFGALASDSNDLDFLILDP